MARAAGCIYDDERGYAIHTWTGKSFYPRKVNASDVSVLDIAHGLAMTCRYGGQCDFYYSVAQHSVHCFDMAVATDLPIEFIREALFHDSVEAYLGADFPRPYKMMIPALAEFEEMIERQLNPILGIPIKKSDEIKFIDETMLATEMPLLFRDHGAYVWVNDMETYLYTGDNLQQGLPPRLEWKELPSWDPVYAQDRFLTAVSKLQTMERKAA